MSNDNDLPWRVQHKNGRTVAAFDTLGGAVGYMNQKLWAAGFVRLTGPARDLPTKEYTGLNADRIVRWADGINDVYVNEWLYQSWIEDGDSIVMDVEWPLLYVAA